MDATQAQAHPWEVIGQGSLPFYVIPTIQRSQTQGRCLRNFLELALNKGTLMGSAPFAIMGTPTQQQLEKQRRKFLEPALKTS